MRLTCNYKTTLLCCDKMLSCNTGIDPSQWHRISAAIQEVHHFGAQPRTCVSSSVAFHNTCWYSSLCVWLCAMCHTIVDVIWEECIHILMSLRLECRKSRKLNCMSPFCCTRVPRGIDSPRHLARHSAIHLVFSGFYFYGLISHTGMTDRLLIKAA